MSVAERLQDVRGRIADACRRVGRDAASVSLVAVSKKQPFERIVEAFDAGQRDFGENLAQELKAHATALAETGRRPRWHFIGTLQRNKVNLVLEHAAVIHSIDREDLALAVDKRAREALVEVLLQVNIGREAQKGGVDPEATLSLAEKVAALPRLRLKGLMAIPPVEADPRPHFTALAALFARLRATPFGAAATVLSMGMSDDFEIAVEHGSTCVRVGTAIFGTRTTSS